MASVWSSWNHLWRHPNDRKNDTQKDATFFIWGRTYDNFYITSASTRMIKFQIIVRETQCQVAMREQYLAQYTQYIQYTAYMHNNIIAISLLYHKINLIVSIRANLGAKSIYKGRFRSQEILGQAKLILKHRLTNLWRSLFFMSHWCRHKVMRLYTCLTPLPQLERPSGGCGPQEVKYGGERTLKWNTLIIWLIQSVQFWPVQSLTRSVDPMTITSNKGTRSALTLRMQTTPPPLLTAVATVP
jgi:hypothetical protein